MPGPDSLAGLYRGRPVLAYDRSVLEQNLAEAARLRDLGCLPAMAVKSFPDPQMLRFFAKYLDGFDCSNRVEASLVPSGAFLSLTNPVGDLRTCVSDSTSVVVIDSLAQHAEMEALSRPVRYMVRLDLLDLFGHQDSVARLSKFGCSRADLRVACRSNRHAFVGFHAHRQTLRRYDDGKALVPETAFDRAEFVRRILELGYPVELINLGGGFFPDGIVAEVKRIRAFCPADIRLVVEPGDYWFRGAGHAVSSAKKVLRRSDYVHLTTDISREAHLKWSNRDGRDDRDLMFFAKEPANCTVHGPSCQLNGEVLTTAYLPPSGEPQQGDLLFWENVSPYSFGWNTSFNGIGRAEVAFDGGYLT